MEQEEYLEDQRNRLEYTVDNIISLPDADDRMLAVTEILTETEVVPDVGKYYTFIYAPKTPRIRYDQFPLIACVHIEKWGFRGYNFHWPAFRNYTWEELAGQLYIVKQNELDDLLAIHYAKFILNPR